ncbi:hypothetical protein BGW36DRAFT_382205, partial [Talaromyces proteolyticus]
MSSSRTCVGTSSRLVVIFSRSARPMFEVACIAGNRLLRISIRSPSGLGGVSSRDRPRDIAIWSCLQIDSVMLVAIIALYRLNSHPSPCSTGVCASFFRVFESTVNASTRFHCRIDGVIRKTAAVHSSRTCSSAASSSTTFLMAESTTPGSKLPIKVDASLIVSVVSGAKSSR